MAEIATLLDGQFDTQAQFDAAPERLKVPPTVAGDWLDRQYATMRLIDAPQLGQTMLYLEWRAGGPEGPVTRQRIWAFRDQPGSPSMTFYTFRDAKPFLGRAAVPGAFRTLNPDHLVGYPRECDVYWAKNGAGFVGRIDPKRCRIVAASGRGMRLDVTIKLDRDGFDYREAGILDSGDRAFAVPPTQPYRFRRIKQ